MDYAGNSDKSKEKAKKKVEKKIEPVVKGAVIRKQKPIGRKFKEVFFGGDFKTAASVVIASVVLPTLRDMLYNSMSRGAENVIYGESFRRGSGPMQMSGRTQYNSPVVRTSMRDPRETSRSIFMPDQAPRPSVSASRRDSNEIIVREREDADRVIEKMFAIVEQWNVVSVADMCELLNIPSSPIDNKYGWTSLNSVEIRQVREGFLLDLPPLEEI